MVISEQGPPKGLFSYVIDFAQSVSPGTRPFFIRIKHGLDDEIKECIKNVERHIKKYGGESVLGWKIWELYGLMIEAEFHAVWRSPDKELYDVTPHKEPFDQILFFPDKVLRYEGKQIDNIRYPLNDDPNVQKFIEAHKARFKFMNRGDRALEHGMVELSGAEVAEFQELEVCITQLGMKITNSIPGRNDFCRCGSGKKAKKCCFK